jgi:hypothetical protein
VLEVLHALLQLRQPHKAPALSAGVLV